MTPLHTRIARRFLQVLAFAAAIDATAFAQTNSQPVFVQPAEVLEHALPQPPSAYAPPALLTGLGGDVRGIAPRPDYRLTFAAQNGLHVSFVTPTAPRESEQLRVQGSLAVLSAFISQRNFARATSGSTDASGPRLDAGR